MGQLRCLSGHRFVQIVIQSKAPGLLGKKSERTTGTRKYKYLLHVGRYSTIRRIFVNSKIAIIVVVVRLLYYDLDLKDLAKQNTFIGSYLPGTTIAIKIVWRID